MDRDLLTTNADNTPFTLLDLVSIDELQRVQDSFAAATGVASIIVDTTGNALTQPSNFSPVCRLANESPEGRRRCRLSNELRRRRNRRQGQPSYHQCLGCGFADASVPIVVDTRHIGDWLMGQCDVFNVGSERIRAFAREIGVDEVRMAEAYEQMDRITEEQYQQLLELLCHVARGLSSIGYRNLQYRRDLTERQLIEDRLVQRERENRALLDTMPDLMFRINRQGIFEGCHGNRDDLYVMPEKFIGKSVREILPPYLADLTMENLERAFATGRIQIYEYNLRIGSEERFFEARMIVGMPDLAVALVRDVTDWKHAQQEEIRLRERLEKAERMESLGILAGGVAHDLNNMLGPLVGYPELILAKLPPESPVRRYIESMRQAAVDASEVIQDLLTLARRGRYEMSPVDLNEVVQACLDSSSLKNLAARKPQAKVVVRLCETVTPINGSFSHLQKLVFNLVGNAFDAICPAGEITVATECCHLSALLSGYQKIEPGEYVQLRVADTGRGIPQEDLDKIFEPYYSKKKIGSGGTGLGLSVVYGVIKDHGGYYDVFSDVGRGTEFVAYFKMIKSPIVATPDYCSLTGQGESILVVDDVASQRDLAAEFLTGLGYVVATAVNGRHAIGVLTQQPVDLVVLDMIMEDGFDGLDTYREILRLRPGQRAVIVSGFSPTDRVQEMRRLGAGGYIRKPYSRDSLGRAVRTELDRTGAAHEALPETTRA